MAEVQHRGKHSRLGWMTVLAFLAHGHGMPQDSTGYYRFAWSMPGSDKSFPLQGLGIASNLDILEFNTTIHSNGPSINVDPLIRPSGSRTTLFRDRGGTEWIEGNMSIMLMKKFQYAQGGSHGYNPDGSRTPGGGLFYKSEYIGTATNRGWTRVRYNPGGTSKATLSQPFAVKRSVVPIGSYPEDAIRDLDKPWATQIPLAEAGVTAGRILFLQALHIRDDALRFKPFNQIINGNPGSGSAFSVRGSGSGNFTFDLSNGVSASGDNYDYNRGFITVEHNIADCADGAGPVLTSSTNVGSRAVTALVWNSTTSAYSSASYSGCHGHRNGVYVIENTGDDIWTNNGVYDKFRFAHSGYGGDKDFICRVDQLENTNSWARAGIMIRAGTGTSDRNVAVFVTPDNGIRFQYRGSTNGASATAASVAGKKAPVWLRLRYNNGVAYAYWSNDGVNWGNPFGSQAQTFSGTYQAGLAAAGRSGVPNTSVYSNLQGF